MNVRDAFGVVSGYGAWVGLRSHVVWSEILALSPLRMRSVHAGTAVMRNPFAKFGDSSPVSRDIIVNKEMAPLHKYGTFRALSDFELC